MGGKKKVTVVLLMTLLLLSLGAFPWLTGCGSPQTATSDTGQPRPGAVQAPTEEEARNATVPGKFKTIQEAVDAAEPGAVITIAPGLYEESLRINKGVTLQGAGSEKTVISLPYKQRIPVTVRDCEGVVLSNLKVAHSHLRTVAQETQELPVVIKIVRASARIENCTVGPGAASGIFLDEKAKCEIRDSLIEENNGSGLYLRLEGTEAKVFNTLWKNNKSGGLSVLKGARLHMEDSTVTLNDQWGVRTMHEDGHATLKNNKIVQNRGYGVQIEMLAGGMVEGNEISQNQGNALSYIFGATGTVKNNRCLDNQGFGLLGQSMGTKVEVTDNTFSDNGHSGVMFEYGATGTLSGNLCERNGRHGIFVVTWISSGVVKDNRCNDNAYHGILFSKGATGEVDGNQCSGNGVHGVCVMDELTEVQVGGNHGEDNSAEFFAREEGAPVSRQDQIENRQTIFALQQEHFDSLELIAERLRRYQPVYQNTGGVQAPVFYKSLVEGMGQIGPHKPEIFTPIFERWKEAYPESVTPYLALARLHLNYGYIARGGGTRSTVSEEGWDILYKEAATAMEYLLQAEELNPQEPEVYQTGMSIALVQKEGCEDVAAWYEKGIAIHPDYMPLHTTRVYSLLDRWCGDSVDVEHFMLDLHRKTQETHGARYYTLMATYLVTSVGEIDLPGRLGLNWTILEQGCKEMLESGVDRNIALHQYCLLACLFEKQELAKELFDEIGPTVTPELWRAVGDWQLWKAWANGQGESPRKPEHRTVEELLERVAPLFF